MGLFDRFRSATGHRIAADKLNTDDPVTVALSLIEEGNAIEESGQLQRAMQCYEAAIQTAPNLARAHMNRGNILLAIGNLDGALESYIKALELDPDYAAAHYNLGHAHLRLKHYQEARSAYQNAISIKGNFVDAYIALGCTLEEMNILDEAAQNYREAIAIAPDYAEAYSNLGNVLNKLGQLDDAIAVYRQALALNPNLSETLFQLARLLAAQNKTQEAVACFRCVVEQTPSNSDAHYSLGLALKELGQLENAAKSMRLALSNDPDNPEKHVNLGDVLNELGYLDNAIASYENAIRINPDHAIAHSNLGNVKLSMGSFDEAIALYRRAIDLQPDFAAAHNNLGAALLNLGYPIESLASTRRAIEIMPDLAAAQSNIVFIENSIGHKPPSQLLDEAKKYGEIVARNAVAFTEWLIDPNLDRNLRVGFVSGDLRDHPVGHFVEGVLQSLVSLPANRIEIFAYTTFNCSDSMSQRIKACCQGWYSAAHVSDEVLAKKIHNDRIDILIDLSGHTAHNRLGIFAWKPAPIQITWLGYLATTGVHAIDYLIADGWTLPESEECNFTEKIWRLPESYLCFTPPQSETKVSALPALENGYITFGCFNNITKISDEVVALWAKILREIPNSRLVLKAKQFIQASVREKMKNRFASNGIAGERISLMEQVARGEYLTPYQQIDIALDPFPYPGITTSVESLWMGVPVLSLAGKSFISRQGVGLLTNAGLTDWIAQSPDEYVIRAKEHANDILKLARLREELRQRLIRSPIFDSTRFAIHFNSALQSMWKQWIQSNSKFSKTENHSPPRDETFPSSPTKWSTINSAYSAQIYNNVVVKSTSASIQMPISLNIIATK